MNTDAGPQGRNGSTASRTAGFTLIELLVVIGIISILAGLLLVGIASAKGKAQMVQCRNNTRQLCQAWSMYAQENNVLPNNLGKDEMRSEVQQNRLQNWVNGVMDWTLDQQNTNLEYVSRGLLYPLAPNPAIYKCPCDTFLSPPQRQAGWTRRTRSFSMNGFVGRFVIHNVDVTANGRNPFIPAYRQFIKFSDIVNPSKVFVFTEEQADSLNDSFYWMNQGGWVDILGAYHKRASNLSYADGHCDFRVWRSKQAVIPVKYVAEQHWHPTDAAGIEELRWLLDRSSVPAE
jgi:prepilin-type N-terminal cleavage/methylation domain-containing protein/prepilin-type processing-associated H-X9-DG protein